MSRRAAALLAGTVSTAAVAGVAGCGPSPAAGTPALPQTGAEASVPALLSATWHGYRQQFIQPDGRVIDPKRGGATTSEGQSYAMLRAAWSDDRDTFARAWRWTRDNLHTGDGLFAYLWGRQDSGAWGRLSGDSASDADQDIALALLLAAQRWSMPEYRDAAAAVVRAIWANEVAHAGGTPYLTAGNWAVHTAPGPTLNPSYLAPYAYRLFAEVDGAHPWNDVVDSSYRALDACTSATLGSGRSAGLPPNWCVVNAGAAHAATSMPNADDYGYDAFRVMWRLALDATWNGESRARDYLQRCSFLRDTWRRDHRLAAVYHHDGSAAAGYEDVAAYAGDLGNLLVTDTAAARQVVEEKLLPSLRRSSGVPAWGDPDNYYQQNWVWFGLALAAGRIPPPHL